MDETHDTPTTEPQASTSSASTEKIDWETVPDKTEYGETWKNGLRDLMIEFRKNLKNSEGQKDNHLPYTLDR